MSAPREDSRADPDSGMTGQSTTRPAEVHIHLESFGRVAAYQILFLRVPAHAAVDDAVGAIKRSTSARLAGFANALLRRLASEGEPAFVPESSVRDALVHHFSLPSW